MLLKSGFGFVCVCAPAGENQILVFVFFLHFCIFHRWKVGLGLGRQAGCAGASVCVRRQEKLSGRLHASQARVRVRAESADSEKRLEQTQVWELRAPNST